MASGAFRVTLHPFESPANQRRFWLEIQRSDGATTHVHIEASSSLLSYFQSQPLASFPRKDLALDTALFCYAIQWLEGMLSTEAGFEELYRITLKVGPNSSNGKALRVPATAAEDLLRLVTEKRCTYWVQVGRDPYCTASDEQDKFRLPERHEGRVIAPTTVPICLRCDIPDGRLVCSDLVHARVHGEGRLEPLGMYGTDYGRRVASVLCAGGRLDVGTGANCVPGRNPCWSRTVRPRDQRTRGQPAPLSLPAALDFLDAEFRLAFGRENRLVHPGTWETAAGLAQPAATPEEFESRMSDLADALDYVRVPAALLDASSRNKEGSLNQLAAFLTATLDAGDHSHVMDAVRTLQAIRRLRAAQQHAGAADNWTKKLDELGLGELVFDSSRLWDEIRALAVGALLSLRSCLHRYEPSAGDA